MPSATLSGLIERLHRRVRLVLPTARSARNLRAAFDAEQRHRGSVAWEPPPVFSWTQWTASLWSGLVVEGAEERLLLNMLQEQSVWCDVLREDDGTGSLSSVDSMAELAMSAWKLAADYRVTHRLRESAGTNDSRIFAGWAEAFLRRCAASGYLSGALLEEALLRHLEAGSLAVPETLELVGFGERLPLQDALVQGFRERGTVVVETGLQADDEVPPSATQVVAADEKEELDLAARWIGEFLKRRSAQGRSARVALLVPNLQEESAELDTVLRRTLAPELQWIGSDPSSTPWEISTGVPLLSVAMVADALAVARWTEEPLPVLRASSLLRSPYVGGNGTDGDAREDSARFDAGRLRRLLLLRPEIGMASLLHLLDSDVPAPSAPGSSVPGSSVAASGVPDSSARQQAAEVRAGSAACGWLRSVHRSSRLMQDRARPRGFAEWMEFVRRLLHAANWPGTRPLNATEFAANRAWEDLLDMVSTLDFGGRRVSFAEALQTLELQAKKTVVAPPSTDAPIQVMSIAEARGCVFDALVSLRCTDANWPPPERANPLLPWPLQRSSGMPGTDPARSAALGRASMKDLLLRCGSVLFTCAAEDESGKLRASPLLAELKITPADPREIVAPQPFPATLDLATYIDDESLPPLPSGTLRGGSAVLKLQAACGFLAFAQMRLQAAEPLLGDLGLDALEGGNLLHRAMQSFWKSVGSQDALRNFTDAERSEALRSAIGTALEGRPYPRDDWDRAYLSLQKERLFTVLLRWLEEELRRGPFHVLGVEQKQRLTVGPLTLEVRMDRIDRVNDGVVFVDYKTGYAADPKHWDGPRPDDPQLPLYALLPEPSELKGLAFARVRTGREMQWLGYQAEEGILPEAKVRDFSALMEEWRATLTQLAEDFAAGSAEVSPKNYVVNCARCAQRLLCRVDRNALQTEDTEDQEEPEFADG